MAASNVGDFDRVEHGDEVLQDRKPIYVMLNKPAGYVSSTAGQDNPTVMELLGDAFGDEELHIAGLLDRSTTGLLLLTNDGAWSRELTLPESKLGKVYLVETAEPITPETAEVFARGIYFRYEDLTTAPAEIERLGERRARLTLYEGKYHQVKRMFHAVGNCVTALHRERVGGIGLDPDLAEGEWRELTAEEIRTAG